jgi:hypothetical protein
MALLRLCPQVRHSGCSHCRRHALQAAFMANQSRVQFESHRESKHPKDSFEKCFPGFVEKA